MHAKCLLLEKFKNSILSCYPRYQNRIAIWCPVVFCPATSFLSVGFGTCRCVCHPVCRPICLWRSCFSMSMSCGVRTPALLFAFWGVAPERIASVSPFSTFHFVSSSSRCSRSSRRQLAIFRIWPRP